MRCLAAKVGVYEKMKSVGHHQVRERASVNLNSKRAWTTGQCKSQSCGDTDKFELMIRRTKLLCEGRELGVRFGHSDPRDMKRNVDEVLATEDDQGITAKLEIIDDD